MSAFPKIADIGTERKPLHLTAPARATALAAANVTERKPYRYWQRPSAFPCIETILNQFCEERGIEPLLMVAPHLAGRGLVRRIHRVRWGLWYRIMQDPAFSYGHVARAFGISHHATVVRGVFRHAQVNGLPLARQRKTFSDTATAAANVPAFAAAIAAAPATVTVTAERTVI